MIGQAVYSLLSGSAAITALVGTRIYPNTAPLGETRPYLTYTQVSGVRPYHLRGTLGRVRPRVEISAQADDYLAARTLADAVIVLLAGYRGTAASIEIEGCMLDDDGDVYHPPQKAENAGVHRVSLDFMIPYVETARTF